MNKITITPNQANLIRRRQAAIAMLEAQRQTALEAVGEIIEMIALDGDLTVAPGQQFILGREDGRDTLTLVVEPEKTSPKAG